MPITSFRPISNDVYKHNFAQLGLVGAIPRSAAVGKGKLFIGCTLNTVYKIEQNGKITSLLGPGGTTSESCAHSENNLCVGTQNGGAFYSDDDGATWNAAIGYTQTRARIMVSDGENVVLASNGNTLLYRSTDGGVNYTTVSLPTSSSTNAVYIVEQDLFVLRTSAGAYMYSFDKGLSWTLRNPSPFSTFYNTCVFFNDKFYFGDNGGNLYVADSIGGAVVQVPAAVSSDASQAASIAVASMAVYEGEVYAGLSSNGAFQILHSETGEVFEVCPAGAISTTSSTDACNILIPFNGYLYSNFGGSIIRNLEE